MGRTDHIKPTSGQIDDVAWQFLRSEFTCSIYADWPIDRRLDAFLLHHGHRWLHDDGSAYSALLDRVMDNIAPAVRIGVLASAEELTS
uniref:Uncharacterized protein n=2 Tax=unclassified Mycobacterium TaxID=2642494 RepID=A0A5Q5BGD2_MYCSS